MGDLFLGLDVSTTASTALVIDGEGNVVTRASAAHTLSTPRPLWSEQDPDEWWVASRRAIREILDHDAIEAGSIRALGLTGQMHGSVLLDSAGRVLRPCILWNDQRTADECDAITERVGAERVVELTGNPVLTGFTAGKILWVERNEPQVFAEIATVLLPKDYVRYRLSGVRAGDVSDCSGTSLFDVAERRWSDVMTEAVGVDRAWLPEVFESSEVCAEVSARAAEETGLPVGTPIVAGAGDQAAQAVGTGVVDEGIVSATLGTSGVVFAASNEYRVEPRGRLHAFCHAVPGQWHLMGVMLSAGGSLRWYRDVIADAEVAEAERTGVDPYDLLMERAATAPAGCEGLLFLPYLTGERTPYPDPHARGAFVGLTLRHGRSHLARSVIEGVSYGLRDSLELMRELGIEARTVRATGGGARSPFWRQMLADVFATEIATVSTTDGAAFGAALLATVGAGAFDSVPAAASSVVRVVDTVSPQNGAAYERAYRNYRELYPALAPTFPKLTDASS